MISAQGVIFGYLSELLSEGFYLSVDPILPFKLARKFGMDQHGIGVFFFHFTVVVVIVTLFLFLVPHKLNKLFFVLPGYFLLSGGAFLTGPSKLFPTLLTS